VQFRVITIWYKRAQESFDSLKKYLVSTPLLKPLDYNRDYLICIDVGPWLGKEAKILEERQSMNCTEGTMNENGSK
jgi:hypothetical protein